MDRDHRRLLPSLETNKDIHWHLLLAPRAELSPRAATPTHQDQVSLTQMHSDTNPDVLRTTSLPTTLPVLMQERHGGFKTQPKLSGSSVWVQLSYFCLSWGSSGEAAAGHFNRRDMKTFQLSLCVNGTAHGSQGDRVVLLCWSLKKRKKNWEREVRWLWQSLFVDLMRKRQSGHHTSIKQIDN